MSDRRRSVLFVIADDWSRLARCYGNEVIRTPDIDALAERGTVFDYAFCTNPSCAVSRACILTGQHSHTHGQYGHCHGIHGFRTHEWMPSTPAILQANVRPRRGDADLRHHRPRDAVSGRQGLQLRQRPPLPADRL